ncbi:MAG: hypothetical protein H0U46_04700 [Actinobacteria bacterium]|nr:hypothetical protein [Actinomycetota bacterium]
MTRIGVVAVVATLLVGAMPGVAAQPMQEANLLVSLPSLGTVTWRCGIAPGSYNLGFRVFERGASTEARLVVGGLVVLSRTVHPGHAWRLPAAGREQRLELSQFTGAGTLKATVSARFERRPVASHCYRYSPPNLVVRVAARR